MNKTPLIVGVNIDIQRTDGRIHSAVISEIDIDNGVATVEWFEKEETKGKEYHRFNTLARRLQVELDAIYKLNKEYIRPGEANSESEDPADPDQDPAPSDEAPPKTLITPSKQSDLKPRIKMSKVKYTRRIVGPALIRPETAVKSKLKEPTIAIAEKIVATDEIYNVGDGDDKKPGQWRKSNCVKEVERIKLKREERRAAQIKQKSDIMAEVDIDVPNWEYLLMIKEYQIGTEYMNMKDLNCNQSNHRITVCLRKRPLNKKELGRREMDVLSLPNTSQIIVHEPKTKVDLTKYIDNQTFRFDHSFNESSTNTTVYNSTAKPLVEFIFDQGMATCFAYGQTGSGKTHTMGGDFSVKGQQNCMNGIYALSAADVFRLNSTKYRMSELSISSSFFEIYSGKVYDLLNKKTKLRVLEDGKGQVQIVGLMEKTVKCVADVLELIHDGNAVRTSGTTSANNHSSRSHAVFQIILRKKLSNKVHGKFSLIDLAGNERGADTASSDRLTRMEGAEINKSLLALKECIRALGRNVAHLPFRASKLTQVLRDSFIGDKSRTCMIAMVSPGLSSCEHTLNTLRYADRVKELGSINSNGGPPPPGAGAPTTSNDNPIIYKEPSNYSSPAANSDITITIKAKKNEAKSRPDQAAIDSMNNLQRQVDPILAQEEDIVILHKCILEQSTEFLKIDARLVNMTGKRDYDWEDYAIKLSYCLDKKIEHFKIVKDLKVKIDEFMKEMELSPMEDDDDDESS